MPALRRIKHPISYRDLKPPKRAAFIDLGPLKGALDPPPCAPYLPIMADKKTPNSKAQQQQKAAERKAKALRDNLRRRKQAGRKGVDTP